MRPVCVCVCVGGGGGGGGAENLVGNIELKAHRLRVDAALRGVLQLVTGLQSQHEQPQHDSDCKRMRQSYLFEDEIPGTYALVAESAHEHYVQRSYYSWDMPLQ